MMEKTRAVLDYVIVKGKLTPRWFPMVPGYPGEFVVPKKWVDAHCKEGFTQPEFAHAAAKEFLGLS